jgi:hypothetical protein
MLRIGIMFVVLGLPLSVGADATGYVTTDVDPLMRPRTARLDVGLLSFETAAFVGTAVFLFTEAAKEKCAPDSVFCVDFSRTFNGGGALSLGMAVWSTALQVHWVRELRSRRSNTADHAKSLRRNRLMIPYDSVMTLGYIGLAVSFGLGGAPASPAGTAAFAAMAGLHLWSLVLNVKEKKRRTQPDAVAREPHPPVRRIQIMGSGVRW